MTRSLCSPVLLLALAAPAWALPPAADSEVGMDGEASAPVVDDALRQRLDDLLFVEPNLRAGDSVDFSSFFSEPAQADDFVVRGLDIVDVKDGALLLGAGSRGAGTALHKLPLTGDFAVEVELVVAHNTPSAVLCLVLSKKIAVAWGQAICKPSNLRAYRRGAQADPTLFREERTVRTEVVFRDGLLTVTCNGRKVDERQVKKGELDDVRLGFLLRNIRLNVRSVRVQGTVDRGAL